MAATLAVPQGAVNYTGVLNALPSILRQPDPTGIGDRYVPFGINWSADGGANNAVLIDLSNGGVQPMGQIAALWVDNNGSNVDVAFLFIASQTRVTVPARSAEMVPVPTGDIRFYVVATGAGTGDQTFGAMFNFVPPPVALAETAFAGTNTAGVNTLTTTTPQASTVFTPPQSGVVTAISVYMFGVTAGAGNATIQWNLTDGAGKVVAFGQAALRNAQNYDNVNLFQLSGLSMPYHNGLTFNSTVVGTAAANGNIEASVYAR